MAMQIFVNRNCQTLILVFFILLKDIYSNNIFLAGAEVWNTGHFPQVTDYRSLRYR